MAHIILDFLHNHGGEVEFNDIIDMILNHERDFSVSNIRSIVAVALNQLIADGKAILSASLLTSDYKHLCYYKAI